MAAAACYHSAAPTRGNCKCLQPAAGAKPGIVKPARSTLMAAGPLPRRFCCASLLIVALAFSMATIATDSPLQPRAANFHETLQAQAISVASVLMCAAAHLRCSAQVPWGIGVMLTRAPAALMHAATSPDGLRLCLYLSVDADCRHEQMKVMLT